MNSDKKTEILKKIDILRKKDFNFELFGSWQHQYSLNETCSFQQIESFERQYNIILPEDYKWFLTNISNGGVGPFYGLVKFENAIYCDIENPGDNDWIFNPSKLFIHSEKWQLNFEGNDDDHEDWLVNQLYNDEVLQGCLSISNFGCGIKILLVVNGKEKGKIWVDDRVNSCSIFPFDYFEDKSKMNFLKWFEYWLDKSIDGTLTIRDDQAEIFEKYNLDFEEQNEIVQDTEEIIFDSKKTSWFKRLLGL